jgi:hypothetical protein
MSVAVQGVAFEFGKLFVSDNQAWLAKAGCFGSISHVDLLIQHKGNSFASTENDDRLLQFHSGDEALLFRCYFPDDWFGKELSDQTDCLETYHAVSAGFTVKKTETINCDGVPVKVIVEAKLKEISLIDGAPAVDTTYARVVSADTCGSLADDYNLILTVGRFIGIHRKAMAIENGGEIQYKHIASSYDVAADRFTKALARLA